MIPSVDQGGALREGGGMEGPWRELPLSVDQEERDGMVVVSVAGELDLATAPRLASRLHAPPGRGPPPPRLGSRLDALRRNGRPPRVLIDLTRLEFCDSTGLRALIGAATELRAA